MKAPKETVVTKVDGSVECFVAGKLSACLARVLAGRHYDPRLAGPLSRAVALHLGEWTRPVPPTTQYVYNCVRSVLQQTGLGDVAEDLAYHRRIRAGRRRQTRVLDSLDQSPARARAWRKLALVATLQNRYGCRHAVARFLAGQIETQVFALNYRLITKPFLAELLRNEVLAWGLADERILGVAADALEHPVGPPQPEKEN